MSFRSLFLLLSLSASLAAASVPVGAAPAPLAGAMPPGPLAAGDKAAPSYLDRVVIDDEIVVELSERLPAKPAAALNEIAAGAEVDRAASVAVVRRPSGVPWGRALARLRALPFVRAAEPNLWRFQTILPNDPLFPEQWALHNTGQQHETSSGRRVAGTEDADIDAPDAWDVTTGHPSAVVAVIDGGVDVAHPDVAPSLWVNEAERDGVAGEDDDGNGQVDDVHGWDFAEDDATLLEPDPAIFGQDHGTHVASTIAAPMNDATGIAGVCPSCRIMVLKIGKPIDSDNDGRADMLGLDLASELRALAYAREMGADVVNASYGAPVVWSPAEWRAFRALGNAGVLTVAASGNLNGDNDLFMAHDFDGDEMPDSLSPVYPATYELPGIVSVAASNHHDEYGRVTDCVAPLGCAFTNWGRESVDLAAPGVDILGAVPGGAYAYFDGTSMAAPHVSGVAGLWISRHGGGDPATVKHQLLSTSERPGSLRRLTGLPGPVAGGSFTVTDGRLNAHRALTEVTDPAPVDPSDATVTGAKGIRRTRSGGVRWPSDVNDVFRKRLVKGRVYKFLLDGPDSEDFDLWLWKPGIKQIWQIEEGCFLRRGRCKLADVSATESADERIRFRVRRTGRYYIHVSSWIRSAGAYNLKVKRVRG